MSHVHHELHEVFPEDHEILHQLKISDAHFQKLSDNYHTTNREIHRIEAEVDHASDLRVEELKKQRLGLIDEVAQIVAKAKAAVG